MKKRILSIVLTLCMLSSLCLTALADGGDAEAAAQSLYDLGLFKGVGDNEDGTPNFDLDRTPNRAEAVTMLVRLLGKEEQALAGTWETPFTDVPNWAKPYVGYAYANGLTNGTGPDTFSSTALVSATQYLTFVLRALGYSSDTDFKWNAAWEKTDEIGITNGEYSAENNEVTRGGMAVVSVDTMPIPMKDTETTLIEKLVEDGAVDAAAAAALGYDVEQASDADTADDPDSGEEAGADEEPGITAEQGEDGLLIEVTNQAGLTEAVNQSEKVAEIRITKDFTVTEDSGVSLGPDKLENYANVIVTVEQGVTLTIAEGGQIGAYWFTYEGDWETGTVPDVRYVNNGTVIVERDGWVNGDIGDNYGTIIVKDGGQCQTIPKHNYGTVTVESGGSFRTTQGSNAVNEGVITVAEGANIVARFGSKIINNGTLTVDGLLSVGYVYFDNIDGEPHEEFWFENNGTVTGSGTARAYDALADEDSTESEYFGVMEKLMMAELGSDTTLTVVTGIGTGV